MSILRTDSGYNIGISKNSEVKCLMSVTKEGNGDLVLANNAGEHKSLGEFTK
jgi:hypothetical protein